MVSSPLNYGKTSWFSKKIWGEIQIKGGGGDVHMGGLSKIVYEGGGRAFNFKKSNFILVLSFSHFSKIV